LAEFGPLRADELLKEFLWSPRTKNSESEVSKGFLTLLDGELVGEPVITVGLKDG